MHCRVVEARTVANLNPMNYIVLSISLSTINGCYEPFVGKAFSILM